MAGSDKGANLQRTGANLQRKGANLQRKGANRRGNSQTVGRSADAVEVLGAGDVVLGAWF
jgi:hypothetical protein